MSRKNRNKGHNFEREVAEMFRNAGFPDARRLLEYNEQDCNGVDISHTGPYKVQCKKLKTYASVAIINEVKCNQALGDVPVLVTAGDKQQAMAVLPLDALLDLIAHAQNCDGR